MFVFCEFVAKRVITLKICLPVSHPDLVGRDWVSYLFFWCILFLCWSTFKEPLEKSPSQGGFSLLHKQNQP